MKLLQKANKTIQQAIAALQANNKELWFSYFDDEVKFTDDGRVLDFVSFFDNAFNHGEKFVHIEEIKDEGCTVIGDFYAGTWGEFKVYFTFSLQGDRIVSLAIGQV